MAKAKAIAIEQPMAGVKKAMAVTAKGVSRGIYYPFYGVSFATTYLLLTVFSLVANNPIGNGIKDGVLAAAKLKTRKKH